MSSRPLEVQERGRARYNTRLRQMKAVRDHLIGMGVADVTDEGVGYARTLGLPGWNVKVYRNFQGAVWKKGRGPVIDEIRGDDSRPFLIFDIATFAEDPDEVLVVMPIQGFINLIRAAQSAGSFLRGRN